MVKKWLAESKGAWGRLRDFLEEKGPVVAHLPHLSRLHQFAHFCLMVGKHFSRNRCPVRASALAYTSLLALIPMLAVALSVSTSLLKKQGEQGISQFIDKLVDTVMPPAGMSTNAASSMTAPAGGRDRNAGDANETAQASETNNVSALPDTTETRRAAAREQTAAAIHGFIQNTNSGTLGVTGMVLLIFAAIAMLSSIEATFNDIWGVTRGRSWVARVVRYWTVISLGPVLLTVALGLAGGPYAQATRQWLGSVPFLGGVLFRLLPVAVLSLTFAAFYTLMPNTQVRWQAALAGGLVAGLLWHFNNLFSVLYVSRVVTNSKIYGSLALVPVVMVGLYFSWMILLFGAQVAYAWQNRAAYLQARQCAQINQRGRELVPLSFKELAGRRSKQGYPTASPTDLGEALAVPARLVQDLLQTLLGARLVVAVAGVEIAYAPARPLETITCHDILLALRAGQGQELATREEPARFEVYGEFARIIEAERKAAENVTLLALVNRTEALLAASSPRVKAVTEGNPG